jgi:CysZ protein
VFGDLSRGVGDAFRGASFLAGHPRLWIWVAAPAVIAVVLLAVIVGWVLSLLSAPIAAISAWLPGAWAENVLHVIATIILAIASLSIVVSVAAVIAGPFNEMLSEAVEERVTGVKGPPFRVFRFVIDLLVGLAHALRRAIVYLATMLGLLILGAVIPIIGTVIAAAVGAVVTAQFAAYDAHDAVFARKRWRYRAKIAYLRERRWRALGLGGMVSLLLVFPGINIIGLAIGATGATLKFVDENKSRPAAAGVV